MSSETNPKPIQIDVEKIIRNQPHPLLRRLPKPFIRLIAKIIHQDEINEGLRKIGHLRNFEFVEAALDYLDIKVEAYGTEHIPRDGNVIFVGNHALGGADFLALMHVLKDYYPRVNHLTNDLLMVIKPLEDFFIPVNVFGKNPEHYRKLYDERLSEPGIPVTIFPSGEVARYRKGKWDDGLWRSGFVRFARKFNKKVLPFFVPTKNSKLFYRVNRLRRMLGIKANLELFLLPHELMKMRGRTVTLIFGEPIPSSFFDDSKTIHEWADVIKAKAYALGEKQPHEKEKH